MAISARHALGGFASPEAASVGERHLTEKLCAEEGLAFSRETVRCILRPPEKREVWRPKTRVLEAVLRGERGLQRGPEAIQ